MANKGGFSWKRALGITNAKRKISRKTGIPLTKSGRQRKAGKILTGGGCILPVILVAAVICSLFVLVSCDIETSTNSTTVESSINSEIKNTPDTTTEPTAEPTTTTTEPSTTTKEPTAEPTTITTEPTITTAITTTTTEPITTTTEPITTTTKPITTATEPKTTTKEPIITTAITTTTNIITTSEPQQPPIVDDSPITLVSLTSPITVNNTATIKIKGKANTEYNITVYYKSGPSKADGLYSKTSDSNGYVSWSWDIGPRTSEGTFKINITGGGEKFETQITITK